jgi:hypothetical protein
MNYPSAKRRGDMKKAKKGRIEEDILKIWQKGKGEPENNPNQRKRKYLFYIPIMLYPASTCKTSPVIPDDNGLHRKRAVFPTSSMETIFRRGDLDST